ncbi:MAG TPA: tripartite tricarboxylate transporter substrate binding protein [Beijerinckiaceae bacterium]|nr:tripartite tricarboxylate transporter substrate binding protein [Beijerinckiaceae bacterium]
MITRRVVCGALLAGAVLAPALAHAQAYPNRSLRLLVPYAAGGGTDAIARLVANGVGEKLGQTMVVENNGAAGGNVATTQAAAAAPDGYTVLMANQGPMVVNPHLFRNMKVDPLTAFDPVTLITATPLVLVVPHDSKFKSFTELMDFAKKNPGKLTYGSAGNGSASHLATVLLGHLAKVDAVHVPYRGAGPALNDLLGGRTDFMITTLPSVVGLIEGGQMHPIAVTTKARTKKYPDVPSIAESGFPDYEAAAWYGFVVPKGTPKEIADKLRQATIETITKGVVRDRLEAEGAEPIGNSPAEFAAMMKAESARWADVVKQTAIKVD